MNHKYNRYISLDSKSPSLPRFRSNYINHHSKFAHSSWLLKEDIDREVTMNGILYTVFGIWETIGAKTMIMLKPVEGGAFYLAESKEIAHAMGYSRMRNAVTGKEHTWDLKGKRGSMIALPTEQPTEEKTSDIDEDMDGEFSEYREEPEEFIDPLVKALQDDITDDGDMSNY